MGTYLSAPVKDKGEESGESLRSPTPLAWGVVEMQGWRKTMEDAHLAHTDVEIPLHSDKTLDAKVFGVFDGHGGPEVARFCALYLVSVLSQQPTWQYAETDVDTQERAKDTDIGRALSASFHALDRMIDDPGRRYVR